MIPVMRAVGSVSSISPTPWPPLHTSRQALMPSGRSGRRSPLGGGKLAGSSPAATSELRRKFAGMPEMEAVKMTSSLRASTSMRL